MMVVEIIQLNNDHFQGIIYTVTQHLNEQTMQTNKPPLSLPHHAHQQGGFLPCKQQKAWKKHLRTYHFIRKAIHIINTQLYAPWITHLVIQQLQNLTNVTIPPPITTQFCTLR